MIHIILSLNTDVHFPSAICDHKQELLDTIAKNRFV